jgi:hypothetical protein
MSVLYDFDAPLQSGVKDGEVEVLPHPPIIAEHTAKIMIVFFIKGLTGFIKNDVFIFIVLYIYFFR